VGEQHLLEARQRCREVSLLTRIADDGRRFVVHADEKLTAFLELQRAIPETATDFHSRNFAPHASNLRATSDWR